MYGKVRRDWVWRRKKRVEIDELKIEIGGMVDEYMAHRYWIGVGNTRYTNDKAEYEL